MRNTHTIGGFGIYPFICAWLPTYLLMLSNAGTPTSFCAYSAFAYLYIL